MTRDEFIHRLANAIVGHKGLPAIIKQVVLQVHAEQESIRCLGAVRAFLDGCEEAKVGVSLGDDDKIKLDNPSRLSVPLGAVLAVYRAEIVAHLKWARDMERRANRAGVNGVPAGPVTKGPK